MAKGLKGAGLLLRVPVPRLCGESEPTDAEIQALGNQGTTEICRTKRRQLPSMLEKQEMIRLMDPATLTASTQQTLVSLRTPKAEDGSGSIEFPEFRRYFFDPPPQFGRKGEHFSKAATALPA